MLFMLLGAHVSAAGGVVNAPLNAAKIGCEVFQFFSRSPRGGSVPKLAPEIVKEFKQNCKQNGQYEWYIHCPYFVNFASAKPRIKYGSINVVRQELERGDLLGTKYVMTHLGSYKDLGKDKGFKQLVAGLSEMLKGYKGKTQFLIEISAGAGEIIGDRFEEIAEIIHHPKLKKHKIGVCYDTQHGLASGYDIRTPQAVASMLKEFDSTIGLKNFKMSHCNDSKVEFNSKRDRHEHIGKGYIGRTGFTALFNNKKLKDINFILETKPDKVKQDLKILKEIRSKGK